MFYAIKFKMTDGSVSWTVIYSAMGEKFAKAQVIEDFRAIEILECRPATKKEIEESID